MSQPAAQPSPENTSRLAAVAALDDASVEAVARRVVELMREQPTPGAELRLVDATTLANELGVDRSWVYAHRAELEHVRLGRGSKGRLRFDLEAALRAYGRWEEHPRAGEAETSIVRRRARQDSVPRRASSAGSILTVRGGPR